MADSSQNGTNFDPVAQNITLYNADGSSFQTSIPDIDTMLFTNTQISINYATQIGASLIMLVVVLVVAKPAKRRTPLFIINVFSLFFSFIRSLLDALFFVGPFAETYAYLSGDFSRVPRTAYGVSVAATVMTLCALIAVECSLVLQARTVCCTLTRFKQGLLMMLSALVASVAIAFRFVVTVKNTQAILGTDPSTFVPITSGSLDTETISIWFFCSIFVAKLVITIVQRHKMGLKQWGPMQIICIMGGCTMVIPSIFAVFEYIPDKTFPEAGSLALTFTAILLPLSSVWAAASIEGSSPVLGTDPSSQPDSGESRANMPLLSRSGGNHTNIERGSSRRATPDIEQGGPNQGILGSGVRVDKTFAIEMDRLDHRRK